MISKIKDIQQVYENKILKDGVDIIIETKGDIIKRSISGTEWAMRRSENSFDVFGVQLTTEQIKKINDILGVSS